MKRLAAWVFVLAILLSSTTSVLADNIEGHRKEAEEVNQNIDDTKQLLDNVKGEKSKVAQQLETIEKDIRSKEEELELIQKELDDTIVLLEETRTELKKAEDEAREFEDLMADRLCAMYTMQDTSYLELLFGSKSLNEFLDRLEMIKFMITYDNQVFDKMLDLQNTIREKEQELKEQEETIRDAKADISKQKSIIEDKKQERLQVMAELEEEEQQYIKELDILEQTSKDLEKTIQRLLKERELARQKEIERQEELKKQQEEQRRKEEEAKKESDSEQNKEDKSGNDSGDKSQGSNPKDQDRGSNDKPEGGNKDGGNEYTGGTLTWPVPGYYSITSTYGNRWHPVYGGYRMHTGIDISGGGIDGKNVVAAADGVVILSEFFGGYGNTVVVDHGGGITTLYAHGSQILVSAGQKVTRGQAIMKVGTTGTSTGPHLHFEVQKNGSHTNPLPYLGR